MGYFALFVQQFVALFTLALEFSLLLFLVTFFEDLEFSVSVFDLLV